MGWLTSEIRKKLEAIRDNAKYLTESVPEVIRRISDEQREALKDKIRDEHAILRLEEEEFKAAKTIQDYSIDAFRLFREIYEEAPEELKHNLSALRKIYELLQQISREVININNTPHFHEIRNSAVRIEDWANQALENIDIVYEHVLNKMPIHRKWAKRRFHH